jgi:diglucosylglycerate octanoyltransferase
MLRPYGVKYIDISESNRYYAPVFNEPTFDSPTRMYAEQKWKVSEEKVAYAKSFEGLRKEAAALTVIKTVPLKHGTCILYGDETFTLEPLHFNDVAKFMSNLRESELHLPTRYKPAFEKLAELTRRDLEFNRLSRMEKILSAIVNNINEIPELYPVVPTFVAQLAEKKSEVLPVLNLPEEQRIKAERLLRAIADNANLSPELFTEIPKVLNGTSTLIECDLMKRFAS